MKNPDGTPANAQLMATLYDKSLDQIKAHSWLFTPWQNIPLPSAVWNTGSWGSLRFNCFKRYERLTVPRIDFSHFDDSLFPQRWMSYGRRVGGARLRGKALARSVGAGLQTVEDAAVLHEVVVMKENDAVAATSVDESLQGRIGGLDILSEPPMMSKGAEQEAIPEIALRENLQETAFFYPQLQTDADGAVTMKFTLPESLTTWRFMGLAHTTDLCYGLLEGEAVAKKDLMVQPNMPRFLREGDQATVSARIINTSEGELSGTAYLTLTDPETEQTVYSQKVPFTVKAGETTNVQFTINNSLQAKRASSSAQCTIHN